MPKSEIPSTLIDSLNEGIAGLELAGDLLDIFGAASAEVFRARELHGDQTDRPLGTGPDRFSWLDDLIDHAPDQGLDLLADWTNTDVANVARARCKAAAATDEGDTWEKIITEEISEAFAEDDPAKFEVEAIQTIAMLANAIMAARKAAAA